MKTLNVVFDDDEFEKLLKQKAEKSWHDFIMELSKTKS
jgi:predicted CopG family antitoxin